MIVSVLFGDANSTDDLAEGYDLAVFRKYIRLFPRTPLRDLLYAYLMYSNVPLSEKGSGDGDEAPAADEDDYAELILVGLSYFARCRVTSWLVTGRIPKIAQLNYCTPHRRSGI